MRDQNSFAAIWTRLSSLRGPPLGQSSSGSGNGLGPHFGRRPAVTTRGAGSGRITYVGTVPNRGLAREVLRWASAGRSSAWADLPDQVTSTGATSTDGRRVRFVHNWNWNPVVVASPRRFTDVLTNDELVTGQNIALGPWDVRVLLES